MTPTNPAHKASAIMTQTTTFDAHFSVLFDQRVVFRCENDSRFGDRHRGALDWRKRRRASGAESDNSKRKTAV